jgi:hypothetical protein
MIMPANFDETHNFHRIMTIMVFVHIYLPRGGVLKKLFGIEVSSPIPVLLLL